MNDAVTSRRSQWRFLPKIQLTRNSRLQGTIPKRSLRSLLMSGPKIVPTIGNEPKSRDSLSPDLQAEKSQIGSSAADLGVGREDVEDVLPESLDFVEQNEGNQTYKKLNNTF
jgi:hypothetical protein